MSRNMKYYTPPFLVKILAMYLLVGVSYYTKHQHDVSTSQLADKQSVARPVAIDQPNSNFAVHRPFAARAVPAVAIKNRPALTARNVKSLQ